MQALKNATYVDTLDFAKKTDLANLKSDVDELNIDILKSKFDKLEVDKLVPVPVDLSKLGDVAKNDVKKMYIMLRSKILKIKYLILLF